MTRSDELRDCATHRIANGNERVHAECIGDRGDVVGAVVQTKCAARSNTAAMPAVIGSKYPKVFTEWRKAGEPVEVGSGGPTVQQDHRRRTRRAGYLAYEGAPATRKFYFVAVGKTISRSMCAADHVRNVPPLARRTR